MFQNSDSNYMKVVKSLHAGIKAVNNREGRGGGGSKNAIYKVNHYITARRRFHCVSGALEDSSELETNSHPHLDHTCGGT